MKSNSLALGALRTKASQSGRLLCSQTDYFGLLVPLLELGLLVSVEVLLFLWCLCFFFVVVVELLL